MIIKVVLAVILVLLFLLLFVLVLPLSVRIKYKDEVEVYAGLGFVRFKLFPKKEKKEKKSKKHQDEKQDNKENPNTEKQNSTQAGVPQDKKDKEKSSLGDTLMLILDIIKSMFEMMGKRAKITIDALKVIVSKPDAADTAVQFGICGGIVSSILAFTSNFGKAVIKDENVRVEPDFVSGKSKFEIDITLSAAIIFLLSGIVKGYLKNLSRKKST